MYELKVNRTEQFKGLDLGDEVTIEIRCVVVGLSQEVVDCTSFGQVDIQHLPGQERITFLVNNIRKKYKN